MLFSSLASGAVLSLFLEFFYLHAKRHVLFVFARVSLEYLVLTMVKTMR